MNLEELWFGIVAFFWAGFFVLEGFDFGVGALHTVVGKTKAERSAALSAIGPFWDGNEVWLIVAGAAMFAAFPSWYATMFSALYLALMLVIVSVIVRGLALVWLEHLKRERWHGVWTVALTVTSLLLPVLFGIALGDLLHGLPINAQGDFTGSFANLLTPYGIFVGITLLILSLTQGAGFLALKAQSVLVSRARRLRRPLFVLALLAVVTFIVWTNAEISNPSNTLIVLEVLSVGSVLVVGVAARANRDMLAFGAGVVAVASVVASLFAALYPNVMVSSTSSKYSLTIANAASADYALRVMTVVGAVMVPIVLLYQGWTYYVFRSRVSGPTSSSAQQSHGVGPGALSAPNP